MNTPVFTVKQVSVVAPAAWTAAKGRCELPSHSACLIELFWGAGRGLSWADKERLAYWEHAQMIKMQAKVCVRYIIHAYE